MDRKRERSSQAQRAKNCNKMVKVEGGTRIEIGTRTRAVEIEDEKRDRSHDGHVAIVDTNDIRTHYMSTRAQPWENTVYNKN
ncbi:hypothetical protein EVAR_76320_1 [Eumeta japonica]|uniref:Uncharacterized protein n=1 Tax=Eumeta variegata TaxID=151549 RepID=A0A4C1T8I6_EUMVA|nr:hypothetical protein EVAR_76320_1 [Eumeta japonica]